MIPLTRLPVLAGIAAALLLPLCAKEKTAAAIEIRMLAFQPGLATDEAYAHDPNSPAATPAVQVPLKTYLNHDFTTLNLTGRKLIVTSKPDHESLTRDGELLGETTLPEGIRSAILLFLPGKPGGKARFQILAIDDSSRVFPAGSFRISNLSQQEVRIVLEAKTYQFKPGQTELVTDPPVREGNQSGMKAFALRNNTWHRIGSGIWPHPGENRVVQILYQNPQTGQVQLRAFDDVPPRKSSSPPSAGQ